LAGSTGLSASVTFDHTQYRSKHEQLAGKAWLQTHYQEDERAAEGIE
jgi:hypothetical protein